MNQQELNAKLEYECDRGSLDYENIICLIKAGAEVNQINEYGNSIFEDVFSDKLHDNKIDRFLQIKQIDELLKTLVEYGWDIQRFGIDALISCVYTSNVAAFDVFKLFMQYDLGDNQEKFEDLLESVGTEESYQRCCDHDHHCENLFYTIYELVDRKRNKLSYDGLDLYFKAKGKTIENIIHFGSKETIVNKGEYTEFGADIGFVLGNKLLVVTEGVNVLFMSDRLNEEHKILGNDFFEGIIGSTINKIYFKHKEIRKGKTSYGQPTIIMALSDGKKIKFTHNFGENEDDSVQARFWITE